MSAFTILLAALLLGIPCVWDWLSCRMSLGKQTDCIKPVLFVVQVAVMAVVLYFIFFGFDDVIRIASSIVVATSLMALVRLAQGRL